MAQQSRNLFSRGSGAMCVIIPDSVERLRKNVFLGLHETEEGAPLFREM